MQDTATKFDQGAHSAGTAQMSLFHQVQAAECSRNFYVQAFKFATAQKDSETHKYPVVSLDLTGSCSPKELTDAQLQIRQQLMDTIVLYADAIQALANGTDDSDLSENSQKLATNIQGLAKQQGFTAVTSTETAALNAAVVTITTLILDHRKYKEVKKAASSAQPELVIVVAELKAENLGDTEGLASKADSVTNEFYPALLSARDQRGPASFLDIVQAHIALQSIVIASTNVAQLNDTLDALVRANQSLANATNGGAIPEISDLISRAQQAVTLFNSSK